MTSPDNPLLVGDMTRLTGATSDMLRRYAEVGVVNPVRDENGYRTFGFSDLVNVEAIRALVNGGLPLQVASDLILGRAPADRETLRILHAQIDVLQTRRQGLLNSIRLLRRASGQDVDLP